MSDVDYWAQRISEIGARIAKLLAADARIFFEDTVRERFVEAGAVADALDRAGVAALKRATTEAATAASQDVLDALPEEAWLTVELPEGDLGQAPAVAAARAALESRLGAFLADARLGDAVAWRLPQRFIDGDNLPSLARSLFRSVAEYRALQARVAATQAGQTSQARRQRWDEA